MTLESKISSLKILVNSLLTRVFELEIKKANLRKENSMLRQENLEFKSKLEKNSTNYHKPSSSEGYSKKLAIPKTTDKPVPVGGQGGNVGKILRMVNIPDLIVKHHLHNCPNCQGNLSESDVIKVGSSHQSFDLSVQKLLITEHQLLVSQCSCGYQNKATLPTYLSNSPVQYGQNIKALSDR